MNVPALAASVAFAGMSLFSVMQPSPQEVSQQLEQQTLDRQNEV